MKNKFIKWQKSPKNSKIFQIYEKGLEYSMVSKDYEQCHPFVWCKDFLHDVIYASINKREFKAYKFKYDPNSSPKPGFDKIRILIANSKDEEFYEKIKNVIDFIHQFESELKIKKSIVYQCKNPPKEYSKVFLIEGNKRWINSPPMVSLYTLIIRVGFSHKINDNFRQTIDNLKNEKIEPYQKKDGYWIKAVEPAIKEILEKNDKKIFNKKMSLNYPPKLKPNFVHNKLGLVGFANDIIKKQNNLPVLMKDWHQ